MKPYEEPADPLAPRGTALGGPRRRIGSWAAALTLLLAMTHTGMLLLSVAPDFPVAGARSEQVNWWMRPLFPQDWNIFAPDPPRSNSYLQVRTQDDGRADDAWIDLTSYDIAAYRGNPLPSREDQSVLRKAAQSYLSAREGRNSDARGRAATYLRNLIVVRLDDLDIPPGDAVEVRMKVVPIPPPDGSAAEAVRYVPLATWKVTS